MFGGRGEIRTHGTFRFVCFQDRCLKPLGHSSGVVKPYRNTLVSLLLQVDTPVQMRFMTGLSISNNVFLYGIIPYRNTLTGATLKTDFATLSI